MSQISGLARTASTRLPVLIIGSGPGGLTLAHSLASRNIPYAIYERDDASNQRGQGYRVGLDEGGVCGLKDALDDQTFERFAQTCAIERPVGGRIDGPSGKVLRNGVLGLLSTGGPRLFGALLYRFLSKRLERGNWRGWIWSWSSIPFRLPTTGSQRQKVDRRVLRSVLLSSQADKITYDSEFESYTITSKGVVAHFANGTTALGSLLVGADGIKSKVAAQLVGRSAAPLDLGLRIIYGKTYLTPEIEQALHPTLRNGISFVTDKTADGHKVTLVIEAMRFQDPSTSPDYIFWALTTRRGIFEKDDARLLRMSRPEVVNCSINATAHWDPSIRLVFQQQAVNETAALRVSTSDPDRPPTWKTESRVTVLGDAVHCMPPTGGQGANAAIYDAALLGHLLGKAAHKGDGIDGWDVSTIEGYEGAMRHNLGDIVGLACVGAYHVLGADSVDALYAGSLVRKE